MKRISVIRLIAVLLIAVCVGIAVYFQIDMHNSAQKAIADGKTLASHLTERSEGYPGVIQDTSMPVLEIGGTDYAGLLEIPAFGAILPVGNTWNGSAFGAPRRFTGGVYGDTFVIGGMDYPGLFDFCDKIEHDTRVTVTDMTGTAFSYTVVRIDRADSAKSEWLLREDYALTLFCRTAFSTEYIAVRCVRSAS